MGPFSSMGNGAKNGNSMMSSSIQDRHTTRTIHRPERKELKKRKTENGVRLQALSRHNEEDGEDENGEDEEDEGEDGETGDDDDESGDDEDVDDDDDGDEGEGDDDDDGEDDDEEGDYVEHEDDDEGLTFPKIPLMNSSSYFQYFPPQMMGGGLPMGGNTPESLQHWENLSSKEMLVSKMLRESKSITDLDIPAIRDYYLGVEPRTVTQCQTAIHNLCTIIQLTKQKMEGSTKSGEKKEEPTKLEAQVTLPAIQNLSISAPLVSGGEQKEKKN